MIVEPVIAAGATKPPIHFTRKFKTFARAKRGPSISLSLSQKLIIQCAAIMFVVIALQIFRGSRRELPQALDPEEWIQLPLIKKEIINHNTRLFRFGLRDP